MQDAFLSFKNHLRSLREEGEPELHERVDLRAWTAIGVGGPSDLLVRCRSADGVQRVLDLLAAHGLTWLSLGAGSRLVPPDRGLRVPVLNLSGGLGLWGLEVDGVVAGAGANMAQVCRAAARAGLSGIEPLAGLSDSVGGAIKAAVDGHLSLAGILDWVDTASPGSPPKRFRPRAKGRGQRGLRLDLQRRLILRARFKLAGDGLPAIQARTEESGRERLRQQPRSAAPVFVDPKGERAERILEASGCLGMSVAGVRMSEGAPNRICVSRTARAADVVELCRQVAQRVEEWSGVVLHPALRFVDEEGAEIEL
ncbi:MAG: FAD-binding protein [Thermoanaerobaculales bacterium]